MDGLSHKTPGKPGFRKKFTRKKGQVSTINIYIDSLCQMLRRDPIIHYFCSVITGDSAVQDAFHKYLLHTWNLMVHFKPKPDVRLHMDRKGTALFFRQETRSVQPGNKKQEED
jgi:hypothetical protein